MTDSQDSGISHPDDSRIERAIRKLHLRPYFSGLLPLFIIAHFGHHAVSSMMRPLTPMIRNSLKLDYTQVGWMNTAFGLTTGLSQLPAGRLADRFGARVMVLLGVTGVAVFGFFIGFTNSFTWLIVFLVLSSLMGGGYHPASAAAISTSVPAENRGRALGIHLIGGTSAFWIVPLIATPIAAAFSDWRSPYLILTAPIAILGVALYILIGKRSKAIIARRQQEREAGVEPPASPQKINWGVLAPFIIISIATGTTVQAVSSYLSLYATDVLLLSDATAGLLMSITPGIGFFAAPFGGYLSDRFGGIRVILAVSFISVPLIYLIGQSPNTAILVLLMVAMGLTMNTRMPTSESFIAGNTPENRRATVLGIYYFAGTGVAAPLAPAIGKLIEKLQVPGNVAIGFHRTFAIAAGVTGTITVLSALFLWRFRKRNQHPEITG
ncbi:MFS transporter [Chloroflexota bacterium]